MSKYWNWKTAYYVLAGFGFLVMVFLIKFTPIEKCTRELRHYLGFAKGVRVEKIGSLIVVQGEAASTPEWEQINEVVSHLNTAMGDKPAFKVLNRVELSGRTKQILMGEIEKQIGNPQITVKSLGPAILLEGTAESEYEADRSIQLVRLVLQRDLPKIQISGTKEETTRQVTSAPKSRWPEVIMDMLKIKPRK